MKGGEEGGRRNLDPLVTVRHESDQQVQQDDQSQHHRGHEQHLQQRHVLAQQKQVRVEVAQQQHLEHEEQRLSRPSEGIVAATANAVAVVIVIVSRVSVSIMTGGMVKQSIERGSRSQHRHQQDRHEVTHVHNDLEHHADQGTCR
jgi:hypothetical protein